MPENRVEEAKIENDNEMHSDYSKEEDDEDNEECIDDEDNEDCEDFKGQSVKL